MNEPNNQQKQQIEMISNQAIADADTISKVYASAYHRRLLANIKAVQMASVQQICQVFEHQDIMIASIVDEYSTDLSFTVELPKIEASSPRDLLPGVKIKPPTRPNTNA